MKIEKVKVLDGITVGARHSRHYWTGDPQDDEGGNADYEALFRLFMEKLFANRGSLKVDGSLILEYLPKKELANERLITAETSFCFHQMEEIGRNADIHKNDNYTGSAIGGYPYHKKAAKLVSRFEEFMPMI